MSEAVCAVCGRPHEEGKWWPRHPFMSQTAYLAHVDATIPPCRHGQRGGEQFCVLCLRTIGDEALARAERAERQRDEARADVVAAAGELLVPIPEPGSVVARLLSANVLMRRERDEARAACAQAQERRDRWRAKAESSPSGWRGIAESASSRARSHEDEIRGLKRGIAHVAQVLGSRALSTDRAINLGVLEVLAHSANRRAEQAERERDEARRELATERNAHQVTAEHQEGAARRCLAAEARVRELEAEGQRCRERERCHDYDCKLDHRRTS